MMIMMMMVMIKPATLSVLSTQFIPTLCVVCICSDIYATFLTDSLELINQGLALRIVHVTPVRPVKALHIPRYLLRVQVALINQC